MTLAVFHDFPGLENGLTKFHDFHDFPGTVVTLSLVTAVLPPPSQHCETVCLNKFGKGTSPSDNLNDRWNVYVWLVGPQCRVWTLRASTGNLLTYLLTYLHRTIRVEFTSRPIMVSKLVHQQLQALAEYISVRADSTCSIRYFFVKWAMKVHFLHYFTS